MSILVTGASGFVGSYLCRELVRRGLEVTALTHSGRIDNLKSISTQRNFHLHTGDIQDTAMIRDLLKNNSIQTVFHLAARLPTEKDVEKPLSCFSTNATGTLSMLNASSSSGVKSFIYTSTMSVYSEPPDYLPVDEDHAAKPSTVYGVAKLTGEFCCRPYETDMKIIILRFGGVYGSHYHESDAVATFIRQALRNQPITIFGDGKQSSDFMHIDDAIQGTLLAWEKGKPGVYNIGSGEETNILELSRRIIEITNSNSEVVITETATDRPFRFVLDISKAREHLGYLPSSLREGLKIYIQDLNRGV